jgi:hypothetical protein
MRRFSRTTSTEQCARGVTAADTLPNQNRSMRLSPLAPTNMQSAPQSSASLINNRFGFSSFTTDETINPASLSLLAAEEAISFALNFAPEINAAICTATFSCRHNRSGATAGVWKALTTRASAPLGQWRVATQQFPVSA